jgi:hypothetical protein
MKNVDKSGYHTFMFTYQICKTRLGKFLKEDDEKKAKQICDEFIPLIEKIFEEIGMKLEA